MPEYGSASIVSASIAPAFDGAIANLNFDILEYSTSPNAANDDQSSIALVCNMVKEVDRG